jgi:REP element-mobilizing transposase RayT
MPSSLTKLFAHLIFSTKDRYPWIDDDIREQLHGCLASVIRQLKSRYVVVGGIEDHVHMLFDMPKLITPADFVKEVKVESSKFAKTLGSRYRDFHWQRGYGMFSVSPIQVPLVEKYIRNQVAHHRGISFEDEFRQFLDRYGVDYDEQYLWD